MYQPAGTPFEPEDEKSDGIPSYLSRLTQSPLLAAEEERDLARRSKRGDETAKARLIEANMRLVVNIAKNYRNRAIPFEDLIQEGAIGLMNAVDRFDPDRGYRFSTYATHWIRQTIGRALDSKAKAIRLPAHITESIRRIERERTRLRVEFGRDPQAHEIAEAMGISTKKLLALLMSSQDPVSLDKMVGDNENTDLGSLLADPKAFDPENSLLNSEAFRMLQQVMTELNEREQRIMRRRLGFDENGESTFLRDISGEMNLSRERVRQIEVQALRKLRILAHRRKLRDMFG